MRLYLSSFRLGTDPQHLVRLAGRDARLAVVANAVDSDPVYLRREKVAGEVRPLAALDLLAENSLVYAGYSAGPCVLARSLAGLERVDDADAPRRLGLGDPLMDGLGVLDRRVVPHVASPTHPESAALDALARRYAREGVPHLRLSDTVAVVGRPAAVAELMTAEPS